MISGEIPPLRNIYSYIYIYRVNYSYIYIEIDIEIDTEIGMENPLEMGRTASDLQEMFSEQR